MNNQPNRKLLLLAAGVAVVIIGGLIFILAPRDRTNTSSTGTTGSPQPSTSGSGPSESETASATPTPDPPTDPAKASAQPAFVGFEVLTARGLSQDQLLATRSAFWTYSKASGKNAQAITLDANSVYKKLRDPATNGNHSVTFTGKLDSAAYKARIEYVGITGIRLYMLNPSTGAVVYNSGVVDLYNQ